ncbi:MAG TPA: hypothetical protein VLA21_07460, partial [Candidatus Limnocylindria bacterium]|nr:hypothetical protein [Candidatus Limnocylindria bacterium]
KFYSDAARTTQITLGATAFYTTEHPVNGVAEQTVTVYWAWPFVGNDAADTADGFAAQTYPMTATLTVTQVD